MHRLNKIYKEFDRLSPVAKTSMAIIIAKFFQKGLTMISSPIFTRIMSSSEYGIISTFTSWQSVIYIIATLNMAQGVFNNGMLDFKDDRPSFTYSILVLANICTAIFVLIYICGYRWLAPLFDMPDALMCIMILYFFVTPAYNYWIGKNRFEYKYKAVFLISIVSALFSTGGAIITVLLAPENMKAQAKIFTTETISIVLGIVFYIYTICSAKAKIKVKYWKYALAVNLPLIPHYLSMYVLSSSDRIMITKLVNTSATAIYNVAYTAASVILIFWNAVDAAYAPWIYQKMEEKDYGSLQKRSLEVLTIFAGTAVFVTLFAPEIMTILGPDEYYEGVYVIPSVVAGVFFTAVFSLYMRIELYLKKSSTIMIATVAAALINLLLNFVFIRSVGYHAAGYTTLICYILLAVFHSVNLHRLGYGEVYNNRVIASISAIVCGIIISVSMLYSFTFIRYFLIFILFILGIAYRKKIITIIKK